MEPGRSRAYYNDTPTHRINVLDYDTGSGLSGRVRLQRSQRKSVVPTLDGRRVGRCLALSGGGTVRRYTPNGVLDEVIEVVARKVTACTFGGPYLDQLFVPTSREGLEPVPIRWPAHCSGRSLE